MDEWSVLPVELLTKIDEHINLYPHKINFRCVCTHWQSIPSELPDLRRPQPPLLLIPYKNGSTCGLYHPFDKKMYNIDLPEVGEKVFKGSGHGWVVTHQQNGSINVVNPLTRIRVPLPPRYKFPDVFKYRADKVGHEYLVECDSFCFRNNNPPYTLNSAHVRNYYLEKIVLSGSPNSQGFRAVALYRCIRLAYCKLGDKKWRDMVEVDGTRRFYNDVTFSGKKLYAVTTRGEMMVCDDIVSCPELRRCDSIPVYKNLRAYHHLINSSNGHIMMVKRYGDLRIIHGTDVPSFDAKYLFTTLGFEISRLDVDSRSSKWVCKENLGDEILFMGLGTQVSTSCHDFEGRNGNRIYFASDRLKFDCEDIEDCFDNNVFSFDDKSIKPLGYECYPKVVWPSPIWVMPNPY